MNVPCLFITWNRLAYTKQALEALLASDVDEIFIWDNASTDGTKEYLKNLKNKKVIDIHLNFSNIGIQPAMNWFLEATKDYEFVAKVDNDTIIPKDFFARMLPHMDNIDIVQAKHAILKQTHPGGFDEWVKTMPGRGALRFHHFVGGSGIIAKRKALSELPHTDWLLYSWTTWQKQHPEIKKAFCTDVSIELLDTDDNGANYPYEYNNYYKQTKRVV